MTGETLLPLSYQGSMMAAQWLELLTGHQKVVGSILVWGSEVVFLRTEFDERLSHSKYLQAPTIQKMYISSITLLTYSGFRSDRTYVELAP